MILDGDDDDDDNGGIGTSFVHTEHLADLERQLYGHVLAAVDLDALANLEFIISSLLMDRGDSDKARWKSDTPPSLTASDKLAMDLASVLIEGALRRLVEDPRRYMDSGPPYGVTPEEAAAVAFDEDCPFCVAIRHDEESARKRAAANPDAAESEPDEECPCCDMMVQEWREEHAEKLAKAGLADVKHKHSAPSRKRGARTELS